MGLCVLAMRILAGLVLVVTSVFLVWFWFTFIDASFDKSLFAEDKNNIRYVFFIGTFTYVLLMHGIGLFVDGNAWKT